MVSKFDRRKALLLLAYLALYGLFFLWAFLFRYLHRLTVGQLQQTYAASWYQAAYLCLFGGFMVAMVLLIGRSWVSAALGGGWPLTVLRLVLFFAPWLFLYSFITWLSSLLPLLPMLAGQCLYDLIQPLFRRRKTPRPIEKPDIII